MPKRPAADSARARLRDHAATGSIPAGASSGQIVVVACVPQPIAAMRSLSTTSLPLAARHEQACVGPPLSLLVARESTKAHTCVILCETRVMEAHPNGKRSLMPAERRRQILEILRRDGSISVGAVEEHFGVSAMTARRDLAVLAENGHSRRTHGGAVMPELAGHEDSFQSRLGQDVDAKQRLAGAVVSTLDADETVFIDSSSSAYFVVREILNSGLRITVLTNSVPVMAAVMGADSPQVELIGLGGAFRDLTQSFVGSQTVTAIGGFFVDRAIFSVKGIELGGFLTDPDPLEAEVKRAMITRARTAVLVAASQKFDERGLNVIVPASDVKQAYLADPPPAGVRTLEAAGVDVTSV